MAESGGADGIRGRRRSKTPEKEDRLSALPDSLIHHILSFLPSTKQAIQTGILSKRWHNQWTFVSNLIFDLSAMFSDDSLENIPLTSSTISRILDQTLSLHRCSKVHKFHIITDQLYEHEYDPNYEDKIRFVVTKQPEELFLKFSDNSEFPLPEFFFCQPLLVKLQLFGCSIMHIGVLNWKSLKDLSIDSCYCTDEVIRGIVSGSPLLQSFEINYCLYGLSRLVIASTSLKTLAVIKLDCYVDILCPNLVQFYGCSLQMGRHNFGWCDRVMKIFLSDTPLLESLKLKDFELSNIRITSKILKKLAFGGHISNEIAISCPHLEELRLSGCLETISLMNLSSTVCASLGLCYRGESQETSVKQILESIQHLNELELKSNFI